MVKALIPILLLALLGSTAARPDCRCRRVAKNERPNGANEINEYGPETVSKIQGRVVNPLEEPVEAIIEVYDLTEADKDHRLYEIPELRKRRTACATGQDGRFCIANLPRGRYMLLVGTRSLGAGMNTVYCPVNVNPRAKAKNLEFRLTLGT